MEDQFATSSLKSQAGEWKREALITLIKSYSKLEFLYNPKNKLYYDKKLRHKKLEEICKILKDARPGTTVNDIIKKFQILRTRYGQELDKIDKSLKNSPENPYSPSVYWFQEMSFVKPFMKKRSGVFIPRKSDDLQSTEEVNTSTQPVNKKPRLLSISPVKKSVQQEFILTDDNQELETFEYTVIDESNLNTTESISSKQIVEITAQPSSSIENKHSRIKKRSKGLGKFVATLMSEIRDDKLFLQTQTDVLNTIYESIMKQSSN